MNRSTSPSLSEIDQKPSIQSKFSSETHLNDTLKPSSDDQPTHQESNNQDPESKPAMSAQAGSSQSLRPIASNSRIREAQKYVDSIDRSCHKARSNKIEIPDEMESVMADQVAPEMSNTNTQTTTNDHQSLANLTCAICLSPPSPLVVTRCGHVACGECLIASFVSQNNNSFPRFLTSRGNHVNHGKCPVCRTTLTGGWGSGMRGAILKMRKSS